MCCLFGFYHYGGGEIDKLSRLTNLLAENATVRGTDAAGIAYNDRGKLIIHKEAKAADRSKYQPLGKPIRNFDHSKGYLQKCKGQAHGALCCCQS